MAGLGLRPYQRDAIAAVEGEWGCADTRRTLLVQATGTGKTVVLAGLARHAVDGGGRVLVLAHRDELIAQARDKFAAFAGLDCGIEKAALTCSGSDAVVVASVQTLSRASRLERFQPWDFTHVFIDEAHHALTDAYRRVVDRFASAKVVGVTATPDRADKKGLGEVFASIAYEYPLHRAIRDGWLSPIRAELIPLDIDLEGVRVRNGDFAVEDAGAALDPYLPEIARAMSERCKGRRTLVFTPLVATARKMAEALRACGMRAEEIDGGSPNRAELLARFDSGGIDVLCNSMLLTEGYDSPGVDCVVVLRPTRSRALYAQMVGRGTRLAPGKDDLLLLDFLWNSGRHDLCKPASLFAPTPEAADRAAALIADAGEEGFDVADAVDEAQRDIVAEREAALARELAAQRKKRARLVDPLQFGFSIEDADLAEYEPITMRDAMPPTERQLAALEKWGIDPAGVDCFGKASMLLDRLVSRREAGLATAKQIRQLERFGFTHPGTWTFEQAGKVMGILAANRWTLPRWFGDPRGYDPDADHS